MEVGEITPSGFVKPKRVTSFDKILSKTKKPYTIGTQNQFDSLSDRYIRRRDAETKNHTKKRKKNQCQKLKA